MFRLPHLLLLAVAAPLSLLLAPVSASGVVMADPTYVDSTAGGELENLVAELNSQSLTFSQLTSWPADGTSMTAALAGSPFLLVAEIENAALPVTDGRAEALSSYVSAGGALVVIGDQAGFAAGVLNSVFGWSLAGTKDVYGQTPLRYQPFSDQLQGNLTRANAVWAPELGSLPSGAIVLYHSVELGVDNAWVWRMVRAMCV